MYGLVGKNQSIGEQSLWWSSPLQDAGAARCGQACQTPWRSPEEAEQPHHHCQQRGVDRWALSAMLFLLNGSCDTRTGSQGANDDCPRNTLAGLPRSFPGPCSQMANWRLGGKCPSHLGLDLASSTQGEWVILWTSECHSKSLKAVHWNLFLSVFKWNVYKVYKQCLMWNLE